MEPGITALDVSARLRLACSAAGGQKAWATKYGISPQYIGDVLSARRPPSDNILAALGLRKLVRYVEKRSAA
jgi:hypothetical protein